MDRLEFKNTLDKILWGKSFIKLDGIPHNFILRSLTIRETNLANFIKDQEYSLCLIEGILTEDQLRSVYEESEVWTNEEDDRVVELEACIKKKQAEIRDAEFFPGKKRKFKRELGKFKKELKELLDLKSSLYTVSAENRAEEIMRRYIVMMSTENIHEQAYWKSQEEFDKEDDTELIYNLALSYYKNNVFDTKSIRYISRNPEWRFRWNASKNGADLFGCSIAEWSEMQNSLVYWSQFYDFVLDNPDRPSDFIINDDDSCDAWVNDQVKKMKSGSTTSDKKSVFGNKSATKQKDHQEQFIMVQKDKDTIKRVQDMNTTSARQQLRREHTQIQKAGSVSEWQLRGRDYVK